MDPLDLLIYGIIYGLPAAAAVVFVIMLVRFLKTPKDNAELRRKRGIPAVVTGIIAGVLVSGMIFIIVLTLLVIANM